MKGILTSIFEESHFKVLNLPNSQSIDSFYAVSENPRKVNFYVVLFIDNLFDIEEREVDLNTFYEDLIESVENYDHQMDKNLSMVICAKRDNLVTNQATSKKIYQVEEDPYVFKKYVLTYTDEQVKLLQDSIPSITNTMDSLYNFLNDHEAFLDFKNNPYKEDIYNLVSKLFIKLPFLNLKYIEQQTEDLSANISGSLNPSQNELKNKALQYASEFHDDDDMREKTLDFIGGKTDE